MNQLEALKHISTLCLMTCYFEYSIQKLCTLRVKALSKIVTGTGRAMNVIVWAEQVTQRTCAEVVNRTRL